MEFLIEEIKEGVVQIAADHIENLRRNNLANTLSFELINNLREVLLGVREFDEKAVNKNTLFANQNYQSFISSVFIYKQNYLKEDHPLVNAILSQNVLHGFHSRFQWYVVRRLIQENDGKFIDYLVQKGYNEKELFALLIKNQRDSLINFKHNLPQELTSIGEYFRTKAQANSEFLDSKLNPFIQIILSQLKSANGINPKALDNIGAFLFFTDTAVFAEHLPRFLVFHGHQRQLQLHMMEFLLTQDPKEYKSAIYKYIMDTPADIVSKYTGINLLYTFADKKYLADLLSLGEQHVHSFYQPTSYYLYDSRIEQTQLMTHYFEKLFNFDKQLFCDKFDEIIKQTKYISGSEIYFVESTFKEDFMAMCMPMFDEKRIYLVEHGLDFLFEKLNTYDYSKHLHRIVNYAVHFAGKRERITICKKINNVHQVDQFGKDLLVGKKVAERIVGALILANLDPSKQTKQINELLNKAIDKESNNETRNIMLEAVAEDRFSSAYSLDRTKEMIQKAADRKKLNKWSEKWLDEMSLPKLYWSDGSVLDEMAFRFLLYRMKKTKGLQSDIEARQVIHNLNAERSEKMALHLLQTFIDSNSDTKIKYYLTLCGLLGSDNVLNKLHSLFRKSIADKRTKMAEYVLTAIAMIGSDKALRVLEVISRKYSSKKPTLSQVALDALDTAAAELNITKDQLADRIIPNFDFDGIFREFVVAGETYRAYIGKDFQLLYFNESNKSRKSIPPKASPEIKKEFKEIAKEVRAVVKSQSDRLERYMIEGRTWEAENWQSFFFQNPIMFVYATQLIWVHKNTSNEIVNIFYCDEDAELYNFEDDELTLLKTDRISILHPTYLSDAVLTKWKNKAFEEDIKTIFPILNRPMFKKLATELDSHVSQRLVNQEIPKGADFVAPQLVKRGWLKSSGDGGYLEFSKIMTSPKVQASPYIEGPAAWYQQNEAKAIIQDVNFIGNDWRDKILIKDVPDAFYSEVMADLYYLIETE